MQDLELKLTKAELPENVQKVVKKELKRIKKMSPQSPEYPMLRHYLELIADLPWNKSTKDNIDISKAREVKFIYSEKATKFCKISTLLLSYVVTVKSKVEILQTFVAFSEYMNFIIQGKTELLGIFL